MQSFREGSPKWLLGVGALGLVALVGMRIASSRSDQAQAPVIALGPSIVGQCPATWPAEPVNTIWIPQSQDEPLKAVLQMGWDVTSMSLCTYADGKPAAKGGGTEASALVSQTDVPQSNFSNVLSGLAAAGRWEPWKEPRPATDATAQRQLLMVAHDDATSWISSSQSLDLVLSGTTNGAMMANWVDLKALAFPTG